MPRAQSGRNTAEISLSFFSLPLTFSFFIFLLLPFSIVRLLLLPHLLFSSFISAARSCLYSHRYFDSFPRNSKLCVRSQPDYIPLLLASFRGYGYLFSVASFQASSSSSADEHRPTASFL